MAYNHKQVVDAVRNGLLENPRTSLRAFSEQLAVERHAIRRALVGQLGMTFRDLQRQCLLLAQRPAVSPPPVRACALARLHHRLLAGDATAGDTLVEFARPAVLARLQVWWPRADEHLRQDAVDDACLWYLGAPSRYDPGRAPFDTWLTAIAKNRLRHSCRAERSRRAHEVLCGNPTWAALVRRLAGAPGPDRAATTLTSDDLDAIVRTEQERQFVAARRRGAGKSALAVILGVSFVPPCEQARAIDRMMKRLRSRATYRRRRTPLRPA